jgi:hypothetical protein
MVWPDLEAPRRPKNVVLAHAFGERFDLPVSIWLVMISGAAVVIASFLFVFRRVVIDREGAAAPDIVDVRREHPMWSVAAVVLTFGVALAGIFGAQAQAENIATTMFWIVVWLVLPLSCGVLGDWTASVNPFGAVARWADSARLRRVLIGRDGPLGWSERVNWWPAALLFFVLVCGELIYNVTATQPKVIGTALVLYAVVSAFLGLLFGPAWVQRGEVFGVLFATWGRLGWFRFGASGRRGFAGGLVVPFDRSLGRIVFVLLQLISVNFDGLMATNRWGRWERGFDFSKGQLDTFRLVSFVVLTVALCLVFAVFAQIALRIAGRAAGWRSSLAGLMPSLLPIAFGYLLAHNLQYVLVNLQLLFPLIGNPVGSESWPLHLPYPFNDDFEVHPAFLPLQFFWYVAVVAIVLAHVAAVVLAHRYLARTVRDPLQARRSEYPWLVAMVGYTCFSLWLIAQDVQKDETQVAALGHVVLHAVGLR